MAKKTAMTRINIKRRVEVVEEIDISFPLYLVIQDDVDDFNMERLELLMLTENVAVSVEKTTNVINDVSEYSIEHEEIHNVLPTYSCYFHNKRSDKATFDELFLEAIKHISNKCGTPLPMFIDGE